MDSAQSDKNIQGGSLRRARSFLLGKQDSSKVHEDIQSFVDRILKEYKGQRVTVKAAIDIDVD